MREESVLQHLAKSRQDRKIAGICGGLGEHTPVPAWIWRVGFVLSTFIYFIGGLVYFLLWIFMPQPGPEGWEEGASRKNNWLKQISKSMQDKKIAGVCGGLGDNSTIPSWCWRVIFVLLSFVYGIGLGLYILLWIFMPNMASAAQPDGPAACVS